MFFLMHVEFNVQILGLELIDEELCLLCLVMAWTPFPPCINPLLTCDLSLDILSGSKGMP